MKKAKNKVKYKENIKSNNFCLRCGTYNVKVLSTGERLCQEKNCLALTKVDFEDNTITTKFKVKEK